MGPARPHEREQGSLMATRAKDAYDEEDGTEQDNVLERAKPIIDRLNALANEQLRKKLSIEQRWIDNLRQYWGKYPQGTEKDLAEKTKSRAFVKLTRHKTNGWAARLSDLLFPTDEKNWGISSTPLPDLARAAKQALAVAEKSTEDANAAAQAQNEARRGSCTSRPTLRSAPRPDAAGNRRSQGSREADGSRYRGPAHREPLQSSRRATSSRTAAASAPESSKARSPARSSARVAQGAARALGPRDDPRPDARGPARRPLALLPRYVGAHHRRGRVHLRAPLADQEGLAPAGAEARLLQGRRVAAAGRGYGQAQPENVEHLATLREMIGEGEGIIDRYVMWEYHGALECEEVAILLRAMGQDEKANKYLNDKDEFEEYRVILYFCNNELLKIAPDYPLDSGESLYSVWNFEKGETSIFGIGVPELIADSQSGAERRVAHDARQCRALGRAAGGHRQDSNLAAGRLGLPAAPRQGMAAQLDRDDDDGCEQAVRDVRHSLQSGPARGHYQMAKEFMDEEASMPTIAQGEQGAATQTLGGMSILFNSANVVFRRVVKSWDDDITTPTLRRFYDWNMQFNQDNSVKGDMQVDARGTSVLLVREIQSQNLLNVVTNWSVHQVLGGWVKIRPAMEKALQTMMVPPGDDSLHPGGVRRQSEEGSRKPPPRTRSKTRTRSSCKSSKRRTPAARRSPSWTHRAARRWPQRNTRRSS
jgi:hypothetical protein